MTEYYDTTVKKLRRKSRKLNSVVALGYICNGACKDEK